MVASLLYSLARLLVDLTATWRADDPKLRAEVVALRRQVQVLERQIKRVRWTPGDRMLFAALREPMPRSAWSGLLVQPETVLGWRRQLVRRRWAAYRGRPRRGRPPIPEECGELILRMAYENPSWGYFRIRGELLKLGQQVAATSIRSILLRAHIPPAGRRSQLTWKQFLTAHAETLVAADFFSVDTVFFKRLYVLIFVHLASRRILGAACTPQPNTAWVTQQARNLSWKLAEEDLKLSVLLHDRDRKFANSFDSVIESDGTHVVLTPLMAPKANACVERWVGSCRRECLDWMLIVSERHLTAVLNSYCAHYNHERPHRSRGLRPPASRGHPNRYRGREDRPAGSSRRLTQRLLPPPGGSVIYFLNPTRPAKDEFRTKPRLARALYLRWAGVRPYSAAADDLGFAPSRLDKKQIELIGRPGNLPRRTCQATIAKP